MPTTDSTDVPFTFRTRSGSAYVVHGNCASRISNSPILSRTRGLDDMLAESLRGGDRLTGPVPYPTVGESVRIPFASGPVITTTVLEVRPL